IGTNTAPAVWMPSAAAAHATELDARIATRSPGSSSCSTSQRATPRICAANSAHVTGCQPSAARTWNRTRGGGGASRSNPAHGGGLTVIRCETSMSRPLRGELLLQVVEPALELVELVERAFLIAPRGQAPQRPPRRGGLVGGGLGLHGRGEH